ncbi:winged helix-turn-helix domain-containing protein [Lelliottia wanjuensis]|uniref:Transcriptional regulator n=1 Tax=Lelliottia wanjuensis TaxID=3050585 RepID=A0AAP4FTK1_9ENTR|nr:MULTISPECIES: transcriptional regulator [unclassified Lelliottia]MDK9365013.1 transcriptional regulator [Lelliottia sp. V106_12]MDK9618799.1 transcriptional regulator [Lelliottia sp. V106_9]
MRKKYYTVNNWLVDLPSGSLISLVTGERKRLGEYQLKLLDVLLENAGKILTREELTTLVWERRVIGNNSLPNAIHALRSALEDDGKQQRIIKTIPKKGYLLEQAWCRFVEKESEEIDLPETEIDGFVLPTLSPTAEHSAAEEAETAPDTAMVAEPAPTDLPVPVEGSLVEPVRPRFQHPLITLAILLVTILIGAVAGWQYAGSQGPKIVASEQEVAVYSNIRIYELSESNRLEMSKEDFYSKIKDTLYAINQQIKTQSVTMTVYYQSVDQTLNYTFALKSRCDNKQLAMAIYHWRIDPTQLNNLILRETRRKISEMETCS